MPINPSADTLTYLALGDSYTIGEAVPPDQSFPYQLAALLSKNGQPVAAPAVIARTGWTTGELINAIGQPAPAARYDLVTLLIGVNDQYRGYPADIYQKEFIQLLNTAITFARGNPEHVFVLSIPDWGVTPFASGLDREKIAAQINKFNRINNVESLQAGVNYLNITTISRGAAANPALVAPDGLHPSAEMYALWVNALAPLVAGRLNGSA